MPDQLDLSLLATVKDPDLRATLERLGNVMADAPPVRPFAAALRKGFGIIAEIKRRSPSAGE